MLGKGLSKEEIEKRLIRLRNLEPLHLEQKQRNERLIIENRSLKERVFHLESIVTKLEKTTEDFKLQIEELRTMVFGKKKKIEDIDDEDLIPPKKKIPRTNESYQRSIPSDDQITETKYHQFNRCACGELITKKKNVIFYEEDIPIPAKKIVRKHIVEKGYCQSCKQWSSAIKLPSSKVIFGLNIQKYICYLNVTSRLSFTQIAELLKDSYQIKISQGEIVKILRREAIHLRPVYEQLKAKIRAGPIIHLDETGGKLLKSNQKTFTWVMSDSESKESVFLMGETRGGGNVEKLTGKNYNGVVVTDDYRVYKKIKYQQLCWAHVIRKFRDLAKSGELEEKIRQHCKQEYQKLCLIFNNLDQNRKIELYDDFVIKMKEVSIIKDLDPAKLIRYKTTLRKNIPKYLTCLSDSRIPLTNNQAEQSLRHVVLKRRISFGSFNKNNADNLAVLLSVLMSMKKRFQENFFGEYLRV